MDSSYSNNDDSSTMRGGSNSIQPYNAKREELSSPGETRRDFSMMRQGSGNVPLMAIPASGYAMGPQPSGKMLVDPATGQQYFVPTAHPQPQVAYYPVFYNSHPVSSAQPVYYQPAAHPGYFMGPPQPIPTSPTRSGSSIKHQMFFQPGHDSHHHQQYAQHSQNSPPLSVPQMEQHPNYRNNQPPAAYIELPPSSAVSLCETSSVASASPYFQRHHETRVSTESTGSNSTKQSDDSFSQHHKKQHLLAGSSSPQHQKLYVDPRIQNFSARHSSATSTSSTSGFNSAGAESVTANSKSTLSAHSSGGGNDGPTPTTRNLFYTSPSAWWGDIAEDNSNETTGRKVERNCSISPRSRPSAPSAMESRPSQQSEQSVSSPVKVTQKAIRMDIDLNQPMVVESTQSKVNANRTPPTAFTVTFDDSDDVEGGKATSAKAKPPVSLQDAARQAPTGRRLMRRAGGGQADAAAESSFKQQDGGGMNVQDPKQYLFSKMFQGYDRDGGHMSTSRTFSSTDDEMRKESDAMSEAGTYIIERQAGQGMITSQILDDSGAESDSSSASSTVSDSATQHTSSANNEHQRMSAVRPTTILMPTKKPLQATDSPLSPSKTPVLARRSLMSDLKKLREETTGNQQPAGGVSPSSPRRLLGGAQNTPRSAVTTTSPRVGGGGATKRPTFSLRPCQQNQQPRLLPNSANASSGSGGSTFRRADGGRFSMRSPAATLGASTARMVAAGGSGSRLDGKPPFRTGSGGGFAKPSSAKLGVTQKESPEMIAWLRRKEYDPRKAANEARQMQQLKQRDAFIANRSISYHNAGAGNSAFRQWSKKPIMGDERSNKSHDDLSRLGEEAEEFAQLTLAESSSSLKKTVDELTQKCHKSIELIRLSKKNSLSPSVENLLESVVESSTLIGAEREAVALNIAGRRGSGGGGSSDSEEPAENISNRLERLSSAFDAIQKYLEESTTSTSSINQSPTSGGISKAIAAKPKVFSSGSSTQKLLEDLCRLDDRRHQAADEAVVAPQTSCNSEVDAVSDASSTY